MGIWFIPELESVRLPVGLALASIVLLLIARRCGERLPTTTDGPLLLASSGPLCTIAVVVLVGLIAVAGPVAVPLIALVIFVCGPISLLCTLVSPCIPPWPIGASGPSTSGWFRVAVHWFARLVSAASVLAWFTLA